MTTIKHNKSQKRRSVRNRYDDDHEHDPDVNERNRIYKLPGYSKALRSKIYVSFMRLPHSDKYLHYWFIEAEHNPKDAPLFFWTNGGPGCSSLLGLFEEIGPFMPDKNNKLRDNEWAWTKFANIVFVEQPVGVGFSYSPHKKDYSSNDKMASKDNMAFLIEFFKIFPEFKTNKLYLTGESYAGHYIPMWAHELLLHNKRFNHEYNFRGCILINPLITPEAGDESQIETYWGHQRIPLSIWEKFKKHNCRKKSGLHSAYCRQLTYKIDDMVNKINPYAIDYPLCVNNPQQNQLHKYTRKQPHAQTKTETKNVSGGIYEKSCIDKYTDDYLNSKAVRQQVIKPHSNKNWYACTNYEYYRLKDANNSMVKYMREHLYDTDVHHFDILIISGTNDAICGTIGTQKWIKSLNLKIKDGHDWKQYFIEGQPKGYMSTYRGHGNKTISLVSVNNGGHEVPLYKPMVAHNVVQKFLNNSL